MATFQKNTISLRQIGLPSKKSFVSHKAPCNALISTKPECPDLPPRQLPSHRDVYAVGDERNRVKIGVSNDIRKRMSDLQTGTADNLRLIHSEKAERSIATKVEGSALKILSSAGKTGVREWRNDVSDDEARDAIRIAHDIERGRNRR